jgi:predicted dinucleotide-binding enzyme
VNLTITIQVYTTIERIRTRYLGVRLEKKIAVIGGSSTEGSGLALRFANSGVNVLIGTRKFDKAEAAAREISIDVGPLENARFLESAAALLIALNLRHRVKHSGIRITGLMSHKGSRE